MCRCCPRPFDCRCFPDVLQLLGSATCDWCDANALLCRRSSPDWAASAQGGMPRAACKAGHKTTRIGREAGLIAASAEEALFASSQGGADSRCSYHPAHLCRTQAGHERQAAQEGPGRHGAAGLRPRLRRLAPGRRLPREQASSRPSPPARPAVTHTSAKQPQQPQSQPLHWNCRP